MNSLILYSISRVLLPLSFLLSLLLLWRGHNDAGGGFVGGLVLAVGMMVYLLPRGRGAFQKMLPICPEQIACIGVLFAVISGVAALFRQQPYLMHQWVGLETAWALGTPLVFDLGVYLAVLGAALTFLSYYLDS